MSFSNVFGGGTLQAADVAYRAVTLAANTTLVWPPLSQSSTDYAARAMDVTASVGGLSLTLPPANGVSTGYGLLINNVGANTFAVLKNDGTTLDTIPAGAVHYLQVTDNTTVGGLWDVIGFGSSTTAANAAALQGSGLSVSGIGDLQAASLVYVNSANYTVVYTDRANTLVWTGGSGTYTLPLSSAPGVGSDFFFELRNGGTGTLTLSAVGGETVDGATTIALAPTESATVHSGGGGAWYTVGRGRSTQFSFTYSTQAVTGGTITLTNTQAANTVQKYTGTLTSNQTIVVPSVVQVYYLTNQTTGAFTLTFKTVVGGGATFVLPQGNSAVIFCDGTNVYSAGTPSLSGGSGTYNPTLVNNANVASSSVSASSAWQLTNNVTTVSFSISVTPTAANTLTSISVALPATASGYGAGAGVAATTVPSHIPAYVDVAASAYAVVQFYAANTAAHTIRGSVTYH